MNISRFIITGVWMVLLFVGVLSSVLPAFAECAPGDTNCNTSQEAVNLNNNGPSGDQSVYLREPLIPGEDRINVESGDSITILAQYVSMIYRYVAAVGGIIAVLVVMFSGFMLMTSEDSGAMTTAKDMIRKTLIGIAMLFLSGLFLYVVNPNFYVFGGGSDTGQGVEGSSNP